MSKPSELSQKGFFVKMSEGSILKHLLSMIVPFSIGIFFNSLYNFVDNFYAGQISSEALTAITLAFPFFLLQLSFSMVIGTGTSIIVASLIGKKRYFQSKVVSARALSLGAIVGISVLLCTVSVISSVFELYELSPEVMQRLKGYIYVTIFATPFMVLNFVMNSSLSARGDTKSNAKFMVIGFFLNLILDPILLYGISSDNFTIIPSLEEKGIALATVIIQIMNSGYLLHKMIEKNIFYGLSKRHFYLNWAHSLRIIKLGLPSSIFLLSVSVSFFVINSFIKKFAGELAVAAYGTALRLEQVALVSLMGTKVSLQVFISQNFASKQRERINKAILISFILGVLFWVGIFLPILIFSDKLIALFDDAEYVIKIGGLYLQIQAISFWAYNLINISDAVLMGIKKPSNSIAFHISRQLIIPIALFYLLGELYGVGGIFASICMANVSVGILYFVFAIFKLRQQSYLNQ